MMDAQTLRQTFLDFYVQRDHKLVAPAPLAPKDDPTLLFNSAGMVQFKKLYASRDPLPYRRAVSTQPCLRAGGKDSDLENVGRTPRHLSFFEMLGNFSFGAYFKAEAISWGWELLVDVYGLDPDRLLVSVYEEDDEAEQIWKSSVGLPAERIVRLGKKDNFWGPAGKTGACGPCSEIYYDLGAHLDGERPGADKDRYIAVYTLVFPQYDMQEDGTPAPLANRGIDTGMGLERLALVIQGADTVFDTDLFRPIIDRFCDLASVGYDDDAETRRAIRVVADHIRGLTFSIAEGLMPSNEGRGYVLRRILRRAARRGWGLGVRGPFLHTLSSVVIDHYHTAYPMLRDATERVALAIRAEEERFEATLGVGLTRFEEAAARAKSDSASVLPGETIFTLYDTYGFPTDLIEEMAEERGLGIDRDGFEAAMNAQKTRSRAASQFDGGEADQEIEWTGVGDGPTSQFTGYASLEEEIRIRRHALVAGRLFLVLDRTPFYAESGGQIGDTGTLEFGSLSLTVSDTVKHGDDTVHIVENGAEVAVDDLVTHTGRAVVDGGRRGDIMRNHTATHLLHAALRKVLGTHVTQSGSLVAPDRLRFDFTHFQAMTPAEIRAVEEEVGRQIFRNSCVSARTTTFKEATQAGAMALFGEKYGDEVREVSVEDTSRELCGGTHVEATGEIGPFVITTETSVAAGVRRVEALTGAGALGRTIEDRELVQRLADRLSVGRGDVEEKFDALVSEKDKLEKELVRARADRQKAELGGSAAELEEIDGIRLVVRTVQVENVGEMRSAADVIRKMLGSGVAILGAEVGGKASFLVLVTSDLVKAERFRADEIVREVAGVAGGSGGGKPGMALAGAKDVDKIDAALEHGRRLVRDALSRERGGA